MAAQAPLSFSSENADDIVIQKHLENLDIRLARVEQILPALATKSDLQRAIESAVAPLATKEDVAASRRHMEMLSESLRSDIRLIAEHLSDVMSKLSRR